MIEDVKIKVGNKIIRYLIEPMSIETIYTTKKDSDGYDVHFVDHFIIQDTTDKKVVKLDELKKFLDEINANFAFDLKIDAKVTEKIIIYCWDLADFFQMTKRVLSYEKESFFRKVNEPTILCYGNHIEFRGISQFLPDSDEYNSSDILNFLKDVFYEEFITGRSIPLSLPQVVKHQCKLHRTKDYRALIPKLFPKTPDVYKFDCKNLFRGGKTRSFMTEKTYFHDKDIIDFDLDSAYIFAALTQYVPMTEWKKEDVKDFDKLIKDHCIKALVKFYGLKAKKPGVLYEQLSKCTDYPNTDGLPLLDKVQLDSDSYIYKAEFIEVYINELDFECYKIHYTWDKMEVLSLESSEKGYIPENIQYVFRKFYLKKEALKKAGKKNTTEYKMYKTLLVCIFGILAQRIPEKLTSYEDGKWYEEDIDLMEKWYDIRSKAVFSPYWAIWVTAHVRYILSKVTEFIDYQDYLYSDTDSIWVRDIKYLNCFRMWNSIADDTIKQYCEDTKSDYNDFKSLGKFESDYLFSDRMITGFKTLGIKRYVYTYHDYKLGKDITVTKIAGLPKEYVVDGKKVNLLEKYAKESGKSIFDIFDKDFTIHTTKTVKQLINQPIAIDGLEAKTSFRTKEVDWTFNVEKYTEALCMQMEMDRENTIFDR